MQQVHFLPPQPLVSRVLTGSNYPHPRPTHTTNTTLSPGLSARYANLEISNGGSSPLNGTTIHTSSLLGGPYNRMGSQFCTIQISHPSLHQHELHQGNGPSMYTTEEEAAVQELSTVVELIDSFCNNFLIEAQHILLSENRIQPLSGTATITPHHPVMNHSNVTQAPAATNSAVAGGTKGRSITAVESIRDLLARPEFSPQAIDVLPLWKTREILAGIGMGIGGVEHSSQDHERPKGIKSAERKEHDSMSGDDDGEQEEEEEKELSPDDFATPSSGEDDDYTEGRRRKTGGRKKCSTGGRSSGRSKKKVVKREEEEGEGEEEVGEEEVDGGGEEDDDSDEEDSSKRSRGRKNRCKDEFKAPPQRRSKMPLSTTYALRDYFVAHVDHPFPSDQKKKEIAAANGLRPKQVSDWFTNVRKRFYKPFELYLESIGCSLFKDRFGVCKCTPEQAAAGGGQKKCKPKYRKRKAAANKRKRPATITWSDEEGGGEGETEGEQEDEPMPEVPRTLVPRPEHMWMDMWD